ncbi:MAG: hypothetical protein AMDU3_IPLC00001G0373 [Thermoplasmatales archaeon I-plasma]|jgi:hypothetical protein|nr:MAG: hypothetical protein AMDU3_IPLC00001G0373 [Thermoplasmatales archaeon I-plasma]
MVYVKEVRVCPVCNVKAVVSKKWVLNSYGKRYNYLIYQHDGFVHYSNEKASISRNFKKGEMVKHLTETISSENFKYGLFKTKDAKVALSNKFLSISMDSVRDSLYKLVETGMLETVRKGRIIYFLNTVYKERLSFVDDSINFELLDLDDDGMFKGHIFTSIIRNDKSWPLYYLPYKIFGDSDVYYDDLQIRASVAESNETLKTLILEDKPREKRLLLKLNRPLFPNESIKIRFDYYWQEPKHTFFFTAATFMKSFELKLMGNMPLKIQGTLTQPTTGEIKDLSGSIISSGSRKWKYVYLAKIRSVKEFSVIHFKWKSL